MIHSYTDFEQILKLILCKYHEIICWSGSFHLHPETKKSIVQVVYCYPINRRMCPLLQFIWVHQSFMTPSGKHHLWLVSSLSFLTPSGNLVSVIVTRTYDLLMFLNTHAPVLHLQSTNSADYIKIVIRKSANSLMSRVTTSHNKIIAVIVNSEVYLRFPLSTVFPFPQ